MYVMIDFICDDLLELWEERVERELQMKNPCQQWNSNRVPSAFEVNAETIALRNSISIEHFTVDCDLPEFAI